MGEREKKKIYFPVLFVIYVCRFGRCTRHAGTNSRDVSTRDHNHKRRMKEAVIYVCKLFARGGTVGSII